jgi:UPF0755 protein
MQEALAEEWEARHENLPIGTPYEALILASIVEKETALAVERHGMRICRSGRPTRR